MCRCRSEHAFALRLLACELARTADRFGLFTGFLDRGFLEMLLELHLAKYTLTLKFFLQGPERLFDIVVAYNYLQWISLPLTGFARHAEHDGHG